MKSKRNKIIFLIGIPVLVIISIFGGIKVANATIFDIGDITASAISFVLETVGYVFGFIGGVLMSIAGYLVKLTLSINFEILTSPTVTTGWQIVLSFANLGFVLAIIVIAFATILRLETYAMKQILWKLIVAALLVNFSLVIAGALINVSDTLSNFFLTGGGAIGNITNPLEWSDAFAGMFKAQALLRVNESFQAEGVIDAATGAINSISGIALQSIASIFFIAIFTILASLTLLATAVMLLIRYVFLGILLILSPIVWLLWIFPATIKLWQKWWSHFIRWTFFAPIMLFFMFLALYTMQNQPEAIRQFTENPEAIKEISLTFGIEIIGEMIIVIGLVVGGLIAANALSITFASATYGAAQGGGKMFGGWVGRKGTRAAGWAFRGQEKIDSVTGLPIYQKGPRAMIQRKLKSWGTAGGAKGRIAEQAKALGEAYGTPGEPDKINKGVVATVFGGMKSGSGIFKKKPQKFKLPSGEIIEMTPADEEKKEEKKEEEKKTT
ncbi:MAG TPA: hypothetical protein ENH26_00785 [Candidatus Wolfebacteria bacterium]|nr:hypothetical protein [Candidatus Wolfebacteria bacterium]